MSLGRRRDRSLPLVARVFRRTGDSRNEPSRRPPPPAEAAVFASLSRRQFLEAAGALALAAGCAKGPQRGQTPWGLTPSGILVNDLHSGLNETRVARRIEVDGLGALHAALHEARAAGLPISVSGGLHAGGGQQFCAGALHLDTRRMARVLGFDRRTGIVKVETGILWPDLVGWLLREQEGKPEPWTIVQKQAGSDRMTIGGTLSANAHGDGLALRSVIDDVDSITLLDANGGFRHASRTENRELFRLTIGGFGLFGVIYSARLRLARRRRLARVVETIPARAVVASLEGAVRNGCFYGACDLDTSDPGSLFRKATLIAYRPVTDPAAGEVLWSDTRQLVGPLDVTRDAIDPSTTRSMTEVCVPRDGLTGLLDECASGFRDPGIRLIAAGVRLIERDQESFLAWARESWACVTFDVAAPRTAEGAASLAETTRRLVEAARTRGGTFLLSHQRAATPEQLRACYPQFPEFVRLKQRHDPADRFQSEWYRHYRHVGSGPL